MLIAGARLIGAAGILLAAGLAIGATIGAAQENSAAATIAIDNHSFSPPTLTVTTGTTVTWKNDDDDSHNVREANKAFASGALDTDDTFSHTFTAPGEYEYFCSLHPYMVGKIIVKPTDGSS